MMPRTAGASCVSRASATTPWKSLYAIRSSLGTRMVASASDKDPLSTVKDKAAQIKDNVSGKGYDTATKAGEKARGAFDNSIAPAYSPSAVRVNPLLPSFTRRREVFVGRLAMLGFLSACIGEEMTGNGIIGQVQDYTGWSSTAVVAAFVAIIGYNFIGALSPASPTFSEENQKDVSKRPDGPAQGNVAEGLSITTFGFSKKNELFTGRTAMLGFAAALVGDVLTSKGPIAQVAGYLHTEANAAFYDTAKLGFVVFVGGILALATVFGHFGQKEDGDNEIY